ncbi:hypothetical protein BDF22DRAFT_687198 [Syncephalis plumigaleata]|nr:hypothetical protein BDF22DRAFT_687198 [Syncephalis plumigaleata]
MSLLNKYFSGFSKQPQQSADISSVQALCKNGLMGIAMTNVLEDVYWKNLYHARYPAVAGQPEDEWLQWAMGACYNLELSLDLNGTACKPLDQHWRVAFQWRELLERNWTHGLLRTRELYFPVHSSSESHSSSIVSLTPNSSMESAFEPKDFSMLSQIKQYVKSHVGRLNTSLHGRCSNLVPLASAAWGTLFEIKGKHRLLIAPVANQYNSIGIPGITMGHARMSSYGRISSSRSISGKSISSSNSRSSSGTSTTTSQNACHLIDIHLPYQWSKFNYIQQVMTSSTHLAVIPRSFSSTTTCICVWQTGRLDPCRVLLVSLHAIIVGMSNEWLIWMDLDQQSQNKFQLCACYLDSTDESSILKEGDASVVDHYTCLQREQNLIIDANPNCIKVFRLWQEKNTPGHYFWQVVCFQRGISNRNSGAHAISHKVIRHGRFSPQKAAIIRRMTMNQQRHKNKVAYQNATQRHGNHYLFNELELACGNPNQVVIHMWSRKCRDKSWLAVLEIDSRCNGSLMEAASINGKPKPGIIWQHYTKYHTVKVIAEHQVIIAYTNNNITQVLSLRDGCVINEYRTVWSNIYGDAQVHPIIGRFQCGVEIDEVNRYRHRIIDAITGKVHCLIEVDNDHVNIKQAITTDQESGSNNNQGRKRQQRHEPFYTCCSLSTIKRSASTTTYRKSVMAHCSSTHICLALPRMDDLKWRLWIKAVNSLQQPIHADVPLDSTASHEADESIRHVLTDIDTMSEHDYKVSTNSRRWAPQPRSIEEGRVSPRELLVSALWQLRPKKRKFRYVILDTTQLFTP